MNRRIVGNAGETAVCRYLESKGYAIRDRNFGVRGGEIDVIAEQGETLCFVEVKSRNPDSWEKGEEAVSNTKMRRIIHAARRYLEQQEIDEESRYIRYDIASVRIWQGEVISIDYLENAFDESDFSL